MEKSTIPTSEYHVSCDTYDVHAQFNLHKTDEDEVKLEVTLTSEDGKKSQQLSLYREDVVAMMGFTNSFLHLMTDRNHG